MKSFDKPTNEQVDAVVPLLSSPQHEAYFFARLDNPNWISRLADRGFFKHPPGVQQVHGGGVRYPHWPVSKYLARMARHASDQVTEIFANIETNNPAVIGDLLDAAMAMPTAQSASLVPAVCRAAKVGVLGPYFKDASDLCARLAENGEYDAAMTLADAIFTPSFDEQGSELSRHDEHWYKEGLGKVLPLLAKAKPRDFIPRLCEWLKVAIDAKKHVNQGTGADYSYIWRPAIEEHPQNRDYDLASALVRFVRQAFEIAVREGGIPIQDTLPMLGRHRYSVFKRLRLHIIRMFANDAPDLACEAMMDHGTLDAFECKHEYGTLMSERFGLLSPQQRSEWFDWVEAGPQHGYGEDSTDEDLTRTEYRRFEKLHWVREHLEGTQKDFYHRKYAEYGEPELAYLNVSSSGMRWGDDSPMTADELREMAFGDAVEAVSTWRPQVPRYPGPSIEGLASVFGGYVAISAVEFSADARQLINRPAIFVRTFLRQMSEAVKADHNIDLPAVLDICHWVIQRPVDERTTPATEHEVFADKDWQWTRNEISELIEKVCDAREDGSPKYDADKFRESLWALLEILCRDRPASSKASDDSAENPRLHDFIDLGINSSQGKAVEAALSYARWIAEHVKVRDGKRDVIPGGFDAMPEVRQLLQWLIADENRSFKAMSVLGPRMGWINWIDQHWLIANADLLFQLDGIEQDPPRAEGWAAWNSFLVWVSPHLEFYQAFKSQFSYAVDQSAQVELPEREFNQPMYHLGEHLMILYGRGNLGLGDDDRLLRRFLEQAHPDIRRHAIGFVGRSLEPDEGSEQDPPAEVIGRFQTLWDQYWAGRGRHDAEAQPQVPLFGTWFASGQFPEKWSLDRLEQFVAVAPAAEPDHAIVRQLAKIATVDPLQSVRVLDAMIRGDQEGWHVAGWRDDAKRVLEFALKAKGDASEIAVNLINFLGRRGYMEFGPLLLK